MNMINRSREVLFNLPLKQIEANKHLMTYCFRWQDGKAIPLNRDYLPLGMGYDGSKPYIDYSDYAKEGIDPSCIPGLTEDNYQVYLFNDTCPPWESPQGAHDMLRALDQIAENSALLILAGDEFDG